MHPTLNIALRAARAAADKLSYVSTNFPALLAEGNSKEKIIAQAMDDAQYRVEKTISRAYDDAKIVFVHLNQQQDAKQSYWHINLLSGSKNFLSGFPYFCVIVSQYVNGRIENTAIVNPLDETEFVASRGRVAQFNEKRIRCSELRDSEHAMVASYSASMNPSQHQRITGCSVLDIAYTAAGVFDACFAKVEHASDLDAALLIAHDAGCLSGAPTGKPLNKGESIALIANAKLFKQLLIK